MPPHLLLVLTALVAAFVCVPGLAFAGYASSGELAFYPCNRCHPVTLGADGKPTKQLPVGLKKHEITLEVHDILGKGDAACLACHQAPSSDPGKLILADGSLVEVDGDVSRVCQRCHFEKYREWQAGIHGRDEPSCSARGCHDPHSPSWIYIPGLPPFQGTGFEVRAVGTGRQAFKPFGGPPLPPPTLTPPWLMVVAGLGTALSLALVGFLTLGRPRS